MKNPQLFRRKAYMERVYAVVNVRLEYRPMVKKTLFEGGIVNVLARRMTSSGATAIDVAYIHLG